MNLDRLVQLQWRDGSEGVYAPDVQQNPMRCDLLLMHYQQPCQEHSRRSQQWTHAVPWGPHCLYWLHECAAVVGEVVGGSSQVHLLDAEPLCCQVNHARDVQAYPS